MEGRAMSEVIPAWGREDPGAPGVYVVKNSDTSYDMSLVRWDGRAWFQWKYRVSGFEAVEAAPGRLSVKVPGLHREYHMVAMEPEDRWFGPIAEPA